MSNTLYIQINVPCDIYGVPHRNRQQYEFVRTEWRTIDHRSLAEKNKGTMLYYVGKDCDDNEVFIPSEYSVVTDICIPANEVNIFQYLRARDMDDTTDYYAKVKECLGIDMRLNHVAQINPKKYEELLLKVPIVENNINEKRFKRNGSDS